MQIPTLTFKASPCVYGSTATSASPHKTDGQARRAPELSPAAMSDRRLNVLSVWARIPRSAFA